MVLRKRPPSQEETTLSLAGCGRGSAVGATAVTLKHTGASLGTTAGTGELADGGGEGADIAEWPSQTWKCPPPAFSPREAAKLYFWLRHFHRLFPLLFEGDMM